MFRFLVLAQPYAAHVNAAVTAAVAAKRFVCTLFVHDMYNFHLL